MMKPGRELDLMVADVMGLTPLETFCSGEIEFYGDGRWYCQKCGFYCDEPGNIHFSHAEQPKCYSTDWAAAGPALEWLIKNQQWSAGLILTEINGKPAIGYQSWTDLVIVATGDTWPHTIALAVVEVTKVKVPKAA